MAGKTNRKTDNILDSLKGNGRKRVLFVCLGNICRSPAAESVLQSIVKKEGMEADWEIDSAGTGRWHIGDLPDRRMRVHGLNRGLDINHICRQIRESDFDNFDLIIGMDDQNVSDLRRLAPTIEASDKIVPMAVFVDHDLHCDHIPDPYYSGSEGFESVLDLLENGCRNLFNRLS